MKTKPPLIGRLLGALLLGTLIWLVGLNVTTVRADTLYGQKIFAPAESGAELKSAVADVSQTLQKMTGRDFSANQQYSGAGVYLLLADRPGAPADARKSLENRGSEAFVIRSRDADTLFIVANQEAGLVHGLYFYLEQLGVHFYFPTDNWTIIPRKSDITLKIDKFMAPDFRMRNFFGTGGFGRLAIDPKYAVKNDWDKWKTRNRFGGEYNLAGHSGEAFNLEKKAILLEHPDYLAKVDGKFVDWSLGAKLNTANPDAVKLYVDWTVERFRNLRKRDPNAFAVSVDPSDGGGHCNSDECRQIGNGSASDQTFYIANQAARAVRAEFPDGWVNLYAYNEHAMPPSFDLEPNVYVSLIPYAFQTTGLAPAEFIKAWSSKVSRMSLYDYWSMPDWNGDLPTFDFRNTAREKLRFWHSSHVEGFNAESTDSAGAMGLAWVVASRLMWDVNAEPDPIINEFYEKSFGPARAPMQRMMERWATGFTLINNELALSYRDLSEAKKLAGDDEAILKRLADYGRYIEYLRLRHDWESASTTDKPEAARQLARYIWRIYPSEMIHGFRIFQLLARGNKELLDAYAYENLEAPGWKEVTPLEDAEVWKSVEENAAKLQPLDFSTRRFAGISVPVPPSALPAPPAPDSISKSLGVIGNFSMQVEVAPGQKELLLQIGTAKAMRARLLGSDGAVIAEVSVPANALAEKFNPIQPVRFAIPRPGRYSVALLQEKNTFTNFVPPVAARLWLDPFRTPKGAATPPLYFYVPKGVKNVALIEQAGLPEIMQPRLWDSSGAESKAQVYEGRHVLLYAVPPGEDGKVWKIARIVAPNYPIDILNAPNVFAFAPEMLMVPNSALDLPTG